MGEAGYFTFQFYTSPSPILAQITALRPLRALDALVWCGGRWVIPDSNTYCKGIDA
jgi:hypothetical protein